MISSDMQLRQHVQDELEWEPRIDATAIGVTVKDAVVTLSGHVESFAQKHAAAEAVSHIRGVRAVANEVEVRLPAETERRDDDIARTIASIFQWNTQVPKDKIRVEVAQGWVTLEGTVDWHFQKTAAESVVRGLMGVKGITNSIVVKPITKPIDAKAKMEAALNRSSRDVEKNICVVVDNDTVILSGPVLSPAMREAIEAIAWKMPGIQRVQNQLQVEPLEIIEFAELS